MFIFVVCATTLLVVLPKRTVSNSEMAVEEQMGKDGSQRWVRCYARADLEALWKTQKASDSTVGIRVDI